MVDWTVNISILLLLLFLLLLSSSFSSSSSSSFSSSSFSFSFSSSSSSTLPPPPPALLLLLLLLLLLPMLPSVCSAVQLHADSQLLVVSSVLKVDVNSFYIPLFSALEQTHVILHDCCRFGAFCVRYTTVHHATSSKVTYIRCMRV